MSRQSAIALRLLALAMIVAVSGGLVRAGGPNVERLREKGPAGLAEVLERCHAVEAKIAEAYARIEAEPDRQGRGDPAEKLTQQLQRLHAAADQVAGQRGASVARLYWYTDLEAAKEAAALSGKPILSLRMLGKLTDEYSCANSRFFRTALYSNKEISDYLREHYVLHWQSVRPVPRVTIDFGDGRKLERTVTGNSAHYVLDAAGRPLDVLPGLYGPQAFQEWLQRTVALATEYAQADDADRQSVVLRDYHANRRQAVMSALFEDLQAAAPEYINLQRVRAGVEFFDRQPYEEVWQRIADYRRGEAKLDESSVAVIRRERPNAFQAGAVAVTKSIAEDPLLRMVRAFEHSLVLDTVRNEYQLHRKIHEWFLAGEAPADVDALNERVYAELFLTPSSDPWLGLAPADAYTALEGGGLTAGE